MSDRVDLAEVLIEDALDPGARERREEGDRESKRKIERRRQFLVGIMQHPEGRAWLKELLDEFHTFETRFAAVNGMARDDLGTFLLAGVQKAGWRIWEMFDEADPVMASRVRRSERLV